MTKALPKLRIESGGNGGAHSARNMRAWLDDLEISHFVSRITLDFDSGSADVIAATMTIYPGSIDIDAQVLVNLIAQTEDAPTIETAIRDLKKAKAELPGDSF